MLYIITHTSLVKKVNLLMKLLPLSAVAVKVLPLSAKYTACRDIASRKLGKNPRAHDYRGTGL